MAIGLYRDLAIGVDPAGSSAWAEPETRISGATIGAPADYFNAAGQNWGLAPLSPTALSAAGCAAFVADVRAAMRHAGAMRIDHVMGLKRLYWIPDGAKPSQGAYVRYPFRELLGLICLESRRNRCIVVGEDLGTVPPGFRSTLARSSVLSTRVMFFERKSSGEYRSPRAYPRGAIASASTHDLPTVAGFWVERDLEWRTRLGLLSTSLRRRHARRDRDDAKRALLTAMVREGLLLDGAASGGAHYDDALRLAIHRFLARSCATLMSIQIEDLAEELEQVNLPGTTTEHPNWRRRLSRSISKIFDDPAVIRILDEVRSERRNA
jgi:4-alpha-glucanotransferase